MLYRVGCLKLLMNNLKGNITVCHVKPKTVCFEGTLVQQVETEGGVSA